MRKILPGAISSHTQYGYLKVPKNVKSECPKCGKSSEFTLKTNFYQVTKRGLFAEGLCFECKKPSEFVIMFNDCMDRINEEVEVYIYSPSDLKDPSDQLERNKHVPIDLVRAYRSTLNVSQSKDNSAAAVMSKRVLESVLKHFLGEKSNGQPLSQQFEQLPKYIDLTKPIQDVGHLVHPDSPLYEMLELKQEIDDETVALLTELLEVLIQYLFVLPEKIESVHDKIEQKFKKV
ncbi:hypothetical protein COL32_27990 [Bacillus pseudomycoides]|uniref:hypothetical protein n=1 Tax=Bacillus pseudomycoides TaxID=64104 RepID=UPI000BFA9235|nr:hypothetical protein [Bacillus pseudomycoides]PFW87539.1 hypothetical protein COL29_29430 [Bacillus pseudomycoides]PFX36675.1 hypothetical protein COL32_27990 [Bacillus pseudomycoides]